MACLDGGPTEAQRTEERRKRRLPTAILCAIMRAHGFNALIGIDWDQAGVSRAEFREWWKEHQEEDQDL